MIISENINPQRQVYYLGAMAIKANQGFFSSARNDAPLALYSRAHPIQPRSFPFKNTLALSNNKP